MSLANCCSHLASKSEANRRAQLSVAPGALCDLGGGGLEPPRPYWALAPQASASANSATPTWTPGNRRRGHPIALGLPRSTRLRRPMQRPIACSPPGRRQLPTGLDHRAHPGPTTTIRRGPVDELHRLRRQPWTFLAVPRRFTPQAYAEFGCSGSASGVDDFYVVGAQRLVGGHQGQRFELGLGNEHPVEGVLVVGGKRRGMLGVVR